ncbi:unnamed protein product, partial [Ectocarpus sp. 12 AP-2014]
TERLRQGSAGVEAEVQGRYNYSDARWLQVRPAAPKGWWGRRRTRSRCRPACGDPGGTGRTSPCARRPSTHRRLGSAAGGRRLPG